MDPINARLFSFYAFSVLQQPLYRYEINSVLGNRKDYVRKEEKIEERRIARIAQSALPVSLFAYVTTQRMLRQATDEFFLDFTDLSTPIALILSRTIVNAIVAPLDFAYGRMSLPKKEGDSKSHLSLFHCLYEFSRESGSMANIFHYKYLLPSILSNTARDTIKICVTSYFYETLFDTECTEKIEFDTVSDVLAYGLVNLGVCVAQALIVTPINYIKWHMHSQSIDTSLADTLAHLFEKPRASQVEKSKSVDEEMIVTQYEQKQTPGIVAQLYTGFWAELARNLVDWLYFDAIGDTEEMSFD